MSYPGLLYPKDNYYLTNIKDRGYFILVDRNAPNISLLSGGEINKHLSYNNQLLFILGINTVGTRQDIVDAFCLNGYPLSDIGNIIASGISIDNVNIPNSQEWISIFKRKNNFTSVTAQVPFYKPVKIIPHP